MAAELLTRVLARVDAAAGRGDRDPTSVTLVAVSKGRSVDEILALHEAGQRDFGENRSAEMAGKVPLLPSDIRWHFVGSLQSRKTAEVGADTWLLHSMDRESLARRWSRLTPQPPPCLLQVNLAAETQKHGVERSQVRARLDALAEEGIAPVGLMIIPPVPQRPENSRRWFRELRVLRDELIVHYPALQELSMGMTDDFEVAVEEGATIIRVGRAIFEDTP
jgi:pyridoxal phosphate enzyme (YggS family)